MSEAGIATAATGKEIGQPRSVGLVVLLYIVTFGIYGLYWFYKTHEEMKIYAKDGLGGAMALVLAVIVGVRDAVHHGFGGREALLTRG
ncbi:MAG: DUF4234 domain-containing protein [Gaiellaceae bacterium]